MCSFCKNQSETQKHLFWDCQHAKTYWGEIKNWLNTKCPNICTNWSSSDIILGNENFDKGIMNFILLAKYTIYCCKLQDILPSIHLYKTRISLFLQTERYIAKKDHHLQKFDKIWGNYKSLMTNHD